MLDQDSWTGLVAESDGEPVGFVRVWRHRQFFGGNAVPMGAVASLSVLPHARGRGVASGLLTAAVEGMHAEGIAVSALYASAPGLYRSRGWEQVGRRQRVVLPVAALPRCREGRARPATKVDLPGVLAAYRRVASTVDGMVDRSSPWYDTTELLDADIADVVTGRSGVTGYLLADRPDGNQLAVHDLVAGDGTAARVLLDLIASWSGVLKTVSLQVLDPMVHDLLLALPYRHRVRTNPWMLRVIDLPAAVAARGWPNAALSRCYAVDLEVDDKDAPWQHGRFQLVCDDGTVRCEPGGSGAVRLTARGLAAWYAGAVTSSTLRRGEQLDGDPDAAARLDTLTGAPRQLWMADSF